MSGDYETPYDAYQAKGYSAKQTFTTIFGGITAFGLIIIAGFVIVKFITALDPDTLRMFATGFFVILLALFATGGTLGIVTVFRYIQKPGIQMPGFLGRIEQSLEEKR